MGSMNTPSDGDLQPTGQGWQSLGLREPDRLPVAIRAHAIPDKPASKPRTGARPPGPRPEQGEPTSLLVFDCETLTDATQALTFGCWRYYRLHPTAGWQCAQEGLFYADELADTNPDGISTLQRYAATHWSAAQGRRRRLKLLTRAQFVEDVLFTAAWRGRSRVVGFNLPFDLSRLAIDVTDGRGRNRGGFSFILSAGNAAKGYAERKHRPRIQIKHLNAHRAQISFARALDGAAGWAGEFLDLRTLTFALTARGHSLDSACAGFGVPGKNDPGEHGTITADYIGYCRQDVAATAGLHHAATQVLADLGLPLTPTKAYSPASLAKATLAGLGVRPLLDRHPDTPPRLLGIAMSAFYGGRAECRIRKTPVPVRLVDFTSTYPTLFSLLGLWQHVIADELHADQDPDVAVQVQQLLDQASVDGCFDPGLWPQLVGYAQIQPDGNILPVRAQYDPHSPSWGIAVTHLTSPEPLWYSLPDLVASALLTGRAPTVLQAIRLRPEGTTAGLTALRLPGGQLVDPRTDDPFQVMTEQRQRVRADPTLTEQKRQRIQLFLKITTNAGAYGIWAEYNAQDLPAGETRPVTVYGRDPEPSRTRVAAPEEPGKFCYPPLAAVLTGAARLMLALLERCVTDAGGTWAMADTDSMGIVATSDGGLIPCCGGRQELDGTDAVLALRYEQVEQIRGRFDALNPYDRTAVPGSILKAEVDATCLAIAAKRYALYRPDEQGRPRLVPPHEHDACSHGLGHLLNPMDPDNDPDNGSWITQLWEHELAHYLCYDLDCDPRWYSRPALARIAATSPRLLHTFEKLNDSKPYRQQVKPFNFLSFVPGAQPPPMAEPGQPFRLVAPRVPASQALRITWINTHQPVQPVRLTVDASRPGAALAPTYASTAGAYWGHPEAKSSDPDGTPCHRGSQGLLSRRHLAPLHLVHVGKEANKLDERASGELPALDDTSESQVVYDLADAQWRQELLPWLRAVPLANAAELTGISGRRLLELRAGRALPRVATQKRILQARSEVLSEPMELSQSGPVLAPPDVWAETLQPCEQAWRPCGSALGEVPS